MMPSSHTADSTAEIKSPTGKAKKNAPYIPSYMDLSNGPEPCVVCTDAATGYHYRCMTCEGCKGFFRRTIQKGLRYHCKWNNNCAIDKTTRNQCQQCRFQKCLAMGMATDLVLNEKQRVAKRKLIEENRERRREEQLQAALAAQASPTNSKSSSNESTTSSHPDELTQADRILIDEICVAYDQTTEPPDKYYERPANDDNKDETWLQLAEIMTPSITKVVDFAKSVPGFSLLRIEDQISLLKSCCMEIMCLRAACRYEPESTSLVMQNGLIISRDQINNGYLGTLVGPIFEFAVGLSKLQLDSTEVALLAATLLLQHDRSGLLEPDAVEKLLDTVLAAFKRYVTETRPGNSVHFARTLMKVTDLRHLSTENAQNVLRLRLDAPSDLPPLFLEMFDEEPPTIIYTMLMDAPSPPHDHGYKM